MCPDETLRFVGSRLPGCSSPLRTSGSPRSAANDPAEISILRFSLRHIALALTSPRGGPSCRFSWFVLKAPNSGSPTSVSSLARCGIRSPCNRYLGLNKNMGSSLTIQQTLATISDPMARMLHKPAVHWNLATGKNWPQSARLRMAVSG